MEKNIRIDRYLAAVKKFRTLEQKEERLLILLSVARLIIFVGGFILVWLGFTSNFMTGMILLIIIAGLFFGLLKLYSEHTDKRDFLKNLTVINQNEADALSGNLSAFEPGNSYMDIHHDFSYDVDLFGNSSLFQYLNRTVTAYGRDILAGWLSDPYILTDELIVRQEAVKELASKEVWRQEFLASGMNVTPENSEISGLLEWIEETTVIKSSSLKIFLINFLPLAAIGTFILTVSGVLSYSVFLFIFLANLFYVGAGLKQTNKIHSILSKKYIFLSSLKGLLNVFDNESFTSKSLNEIKENISGKRISAVVSVKKLGNLIQSFDSRLNLFAGFILNGMLLWDYQCIYRLEKWKTEYKAMFPLWLEMIGCVDAYISIGNYAYNNPGFIYPGLSENATVLSARNLGHQLIDENKRVCNDFTLEKKGSVCIISGANMAGKSTFLRTVAINFILGMAGAPVCAGSMSFSPVKLFTSMRTTDSLSDNESYFYAELKRLKTLKSRIENGEPVFMILDEILKGTNSEDKSMGSKMFLQGIIEKGGTGLIATHDTSLGKMESDHPGIITNKCFEIEIDGENIIFDYKLYDGITKKMNAVFLMKQMGILD